MRAPFTTLCTLFDGPSTGTPGFPRVVNAPCRLVGDPAFRTLDGPESASLVYLTLDAGAPFGPQVTDLGGGVYQYDYGFADRVEIALFVGITWVAIRTELCTPSPPLTPYFRIHLLPDLGALTPCQLTYGDGYELSVTGGPIISTLFRVGPAEWSDGHRWTLTAEGLPINPMCLSTWTLTDGTCTYATLFNGTGFVNLLPALGTCQPMTLTAI